MKFNQTGGLYQGGIKLLRYNARWPDAKIKQINTRVLRNFFAITGKF